MTEAASLAALRAEMEEELVRRILPFWMQSAVDRRQGGFVGLVDEQGRPDHEAPKGAILNTRILWTFAAAHRVLGGAEYRDAADRALGFVRSHLLDADHGGVFWMVRADGAPLDTRKHVYAQAFAIYALSEHHRATGEERSLREAVELFRLVERHAHDPVHRGYQEAFDRSWVLVDDVRLSEGDADERKSMNTHLHLLEAYTTLFRVWPDALLGQRLRSLVELFLERIVGAERGHGCAFFDEQWTRRSQLVSFGHDIEASWLLTEAVDALADAALRARAVETAIRIADAVLRDALDPLGGIFYERRPGGEVETDKEWWPQAEAIVGFLNAYQETEREEFASAARSVWDFTRRHLRDLERGEWHRRVSREGVPRAGYEKVGPWKGPYHNGRACLEVLTRVGATAHRAVG